MRETQEVEVTLSRYLQYSKAKTLASFDRSHNRLAAIDSTLSALAAQVSTIDHDVYIRQALAIYSDGVCNNEPLPVILAKIEAHRLNVLHLLERADQISRQPVSSSSVYCSDCASKIRMLLKCVCAQHLRVFLLSYRKSIRRLCYTSPNSATFPPIRNKDGRIAPAA